MKIKKILPFIFFFFVAACGSPGTSNQFNVPQYATNRAIVDKTKELFNLSESKYYTYYTAKEELLDDEAGYGVVAVLVPNSDLKKISNRTFTDYGQNCYVRDQEQFKIKEDSLVIPFSTSTSIESFKAYCDSQIPDFIMSYVINLSQGDGYNVVSWKYEDFTVTAKFTK